MVRPTKLFWIEAKNVLWYLKCATQFGPWYIQTERVKLCGFTNVDCVGSPLDQKSTSGGIFSVGSATASRYIRKQISVALSSAEVEYMATSQALY